MTDYLPNRRTIDCVLFGGTFDPPHRGHVEMALAALDFFPKSQLWIIPADVPPLAGGDASKQPHLPFEDRVALAEAAFVESLNPKYQARVRICRFEQQLSKPNYTARTVAYLKSEFPELKFAFLMGQDQLENFPLWRDPLEITKQIALAGCPREGQGKPIQTTMVRCIERLGGEAAVSVCGSYLGCFPTFEQSFFTLDREVTGAASESIRNALNKGDAVDHWLTEGVGDIIKSNKLYGVSP